MCMDPMNLDTFSVRLLNCIHGCNESEHIFCRATQLYAWTQWIWAHFLLGYSTVCMDPMSLCNFLLGYSTVCIDQMNLGTFPVELLNCVHGPNESGHISCWATQLCADQMNLCIFPVGLLNCVYGPNESGQIFVGLLNCAWAQLIWAHFLLQLG